MVRVLTVKTVCDNLIWCIKFIAHISLGQYINTSPMPNRIVPPRCVCTDEFYAYMYQI